MQFVQLYNPISVQEKSVKSNISESGEMQQTFQSLLDSLEISEMDSQNKESSLFSSICQEILTTEVINLIENQGSNNSMGEIDLEISEIEQELSQEKAVNDETDIANGMIMNTAIDIVDSSSQTDFTNKSMLGTTEEKLLNEFLQFDAKKEPTVVNENIIPFEETTLSEKTNSTISKKGNENEKFNLFFGLATEKKNPKEIIEKKQLNSNVLTPELKKMLENNKPMSKDGLVTEDESQQKTEISAQNINQIKEKINEKTHVLQQDQSTVALNDKKGNHSLKESSNESFNNYGNQTQENNDNVQSKIFGETLEKSSNYINGEAKTPTVTAKEIPDYFLKQITSKVKFNKLEGTSELNVKLKPDYLGKLTLKLTSHEGQVAVKILTETNHAREFVEQNIQQLKQNLINQGIKCSAIDVQLGGESSFHFFGQFKNPFSQSKNYSNKNKTFKNNKYENQNEGIYSLEPGIIKSGLSEVELLA